jgi:hypothetical protein
MTMLKILINNDFGGFGLSRAAILWLREQMYAPAFKAVLKGEYYGGGMDSEDLETREPTGYLRFFAGARRADPLLIACFETLGDAADQHYPLRRCLEIVEINDGVEWELREYDGKEWIVDWRGNVLAGNPP